MKGNLLCTILFFVGFSTWSLVSGMSINEMMYSVKGVGYKELVEQKEICEESLPRSQNCSLVWYWEPDE